jgi:hypothetical protein
MVAKANGEGSESTLELADAHVCVVVADGAAGTWPARRNWLPFIAPSLIVRTRHFTPRDRERHSVASDFERICAYSLAHRDKRNERVNLGRTSTAPR